ARRLRQPLVTGFAEPQVGAVDKYPDPWIFDFTQKESGIVLRVVVNNQDFIRRKGIGQQGLETEFQIGAGVVIDNNDAGFLPLFHGYTSASATGPKQQSSPVIARDRPCSGGENLPPGACSR